MRIKFVIALALSVVCLLPIVTGVSTAQQDNPNKVNLDYQVYLPFVSKPPCTPTKATAYVATSKPVVRVGEIVTVTGALVNDCAPVGHPFYGISSQPEGILYPSSATGYGDPPAIAYGSYQEITFTVQAVGTGVVTITFGAIYETQPPGHWDSVGSSPFVMRVLP
jgi:hypothetical protein